MRQLQLLLVGVVAAMMPGALAATTNAGYSYSLSVSKHSVVVTVLPNGKSWLIVDSKECGKDRFGQPRAELGKTHIVLSKENHSQSLCFWIGEGDEVEIEVGLPQNMRPAPRSAKRLFIKKRTVTREKYTSGDIYSPATNYEFKYQLPSAGLIYQVTQTTGTEGLTSEFREAVETLKLRTPLVARKVK